MKTADKMFERLGYEKYEQSKSNERGIQEVFYDIKKYKIKRLENNLEEEY